MYSYKTPFLILNRLTSSPVLLGLNGWVFLWTWAWERSASNAFIDYCEEVEKLK